MTTTLKMENGDLVVDAGTGQVVLIADTEKLRQDVQLALDLARVRDLVGFVADPATVRATLYRKVQSILNVLKARQGLVQSASRSSKERFDRVTRFTLSPATVDGRISPTHYVYRLDVVSVNGQSTSVTGTLGV